MLNTVILIGRLTKDPDLKYTPAGVAVAQFTLAVDRPFTSGENQQREADFIPIVTWRQLAETVANYTRKGRLVAVEGRIQVRNYENNEGKRVYVTEIIANNVRFLDKAPENAQEGAGGSRGGGGSNNSYGGGGGGYGSGGGGRNNNSDPFSGDGKPIDISEDDLPF